MKIVLVIGSGIIFSIVIALTMFIVLIPSAILAGIAFVFFKSAGLLWNAGTITAALIVGILVFAALLYVIAFVCVPIAIFFPAYAMYFLAERFPGLYAKLYGTPLVPTPGWTPVPPLTPAPIG